MRRTGRRVSFHFTISSYFRKKFWFWRDDKKVVEMIQIGWLWFFLTVEIDL